MPVPTAPPGPPPPPWHPTARITVGIAHDGAGAPLDGALVQAARSLVPAFVTCLPLRTEGDLGEQSIQVSLAASGAPLWALPTLQAQPTLFGRCLLEQSCHFRGPTASIGRSVWVPVKAALDLPPEPPGPGQAARVTVTMDGAGSSADVGRQVLESAARACASQARLLRETRFTVRISAARGAEIATSSPDGSAPARDPLVGCTVAQIAARIPPKTRGNGFSGVVRWEP